MVNLFKSHITALEKVRSALYFPSTSIGGLGIQAVLTRDDIDKRNVALKHINNALRNLSNCNQILCKKVLK